MIEEVEIVNSENYQSANLEAQNQNVEMNLANNERNSMDDLHSW